MSPIPAAGQPAVGFPINEFRFQSRSGPQTSTGDAANWQDINELALKFDGADSGHFLVTLTLSDTWNSFGTNDVDFGGEFRLVLRTGPAAGQEDQELGHGCYTSVANQQHIPFSLSCVAEVSPGGGGPAVVAQWRALNGG